MFAVILGAPKLLDLCSREGKRQPLSFSNPIFFNSTMPTAIYIFTVQNFAPDK